MCETQDRAVTVVEVPNDVVSGLFRQNRAAVQEILGCSTVYGFLRTDAIGIVEVCVRAAVLGQGIQSAACPSQRFPAVS